MILICFFVLQQKLIFAINCVKGLVHPNISVSFKTCMTKDDILKTVNATKQFWLTLRNGPKKKKKTKQLKDISNVPQ